MAVWYVCPSARAPLEARRCFEAWQWRGYRTASLREDGERVSEWSMRQERFPGYARSVNRLAKTILRADPTCTVIVTGGDDTLPDERRVAGQIEALFLERFGGTLGVMQPTGDTWTMDASPVPHAARVAGSPWLGREWCERAYGGNGPLPAHYFHMFVDQELQEVATALGLFWQNPEVTHRHEHWMRTGEEEPAHLKPAHARWGSDEATFLRRKAEGFPGSGLK